uniref:Uncharacterized protein n=1 Tax=Trichogramma kaykai TaxID=54128 RepID=A0ABD2WIB2_9HYME
MKLERKRARESALHKFDDRPLLNSICGYKKEYKGSLRQRPKLVAAQRRRHKRKALRFSHICAARNVSPFFLRFLFFYDDYTRARRTRILGIYAKKLLETYSARHNAPKTYKEAIGGDGAKVCEQPSSQTHYTRPVAFVYSYTYISRARLEQCLILGVASLSSPPNNNTRAISMCTRIGRNAYCIERATVDPAISASIRDISNGCCFFLSLASVRGGVSDPEANIHATMYLRLYTRCRAVRCVRVMLDGHRDARTQTHIHCVSVTSAQSELAAVQRCASSTGEGVIGGTRSSSSGNSDGAAAAMWRAGDDLVMTSRTASCYAHGSSLNYANVLNSRLEVGCFRALLLVAREYVDSHAQVFARITIVLYFDECHLPYNKLLAILNGVIKINHIECKLRARERYYRNCDDDVDVELLYCVVYDIRRVKSPESISKDMSNIIIYSTSSLFYPKIAHSRAPNVKSLWHWCIYTPRIDWINRPKALEIIAPFSSPRRVGHELRRRAVVVGVVSSYI